MDKNSSLFTAVPAAELRKLPSFLLRKKKKKSQQQRNRVPQHAVNIRVSKLMVTANGAGAVVSHSWPTSG